MTKLIVAFRNSAKVPKNDDNYISIPSTGLNLNGVSRVNCVSYPLPGTCR